SSCSGALSFPTRRSSDLASAISASKKILCNSFWFFARVARLYDSHRSTSKNKRPHRRQAHGLSVAKHRLNDHRRYKRHERVCLRSEEHTSELQSRFDLVC